MSVVEQLPVIDSTILFTRVVGLGLLDTGSGCREVGRGGVNKTSSKSCIR